MGVEHAYINECPFEPASPEATCLDVESSTSCEIAKEAVGASPERGCRCGSTRTSWHTSVSRRAVRSRTWLCRSVGKPPLWHERLCSIEKLEPQSQ